MYVENNGGDETVVFDATSDRQGSSGGVIYSVQNIQNNTVEFSITMMIREVEFRIGADAKTYILNDNGTTEGTSQGCHWRFLKSGACIRRIKFAPRISFGVKV